MSKFQSNFRESNYPERLHKYSGRSRVIRGWKEGGADWREAWMEAGREVGKEAGREGERKGRTGGREGEREGQTGASNSKPIFHGINVP